MTAITQESYGKTKDGKEVLLWVYSTWHITKLL